MFVHHWFYTPKGKILQLIHVIVFPNVFITCHIFFKLSCCHMFRICVFMSDHMFDIRMTTYLNCLLGDLCVDIICLMFEILNTWVTTNSLSLLTLYVEILFANLIACCLLPWNILTYTFSCWNGYTYQIRIWVLY
jgi:hypothetical protein